MRKTLLILLLTLFSSQILAQGEMEEFPWSRAAKIVGADESRAVARKKAEQRQKGQLEKGDGEKREKKTEADNDKKGK
jgi:hypothetical protein